MGQERVLPPAGRDVVGQVTGAHDLRTLTGRGTRREYSYG